MEYRALYGMNYTDTEGEERRVEAGEKIDKMPADEIRTQMRKKNIEEWEAYQTEHVHDGKGEGEEVQGVQSRHADGGERIELKKAVK